MSDDSKSENFQRMLDRPPTKKVPAKNPRLAIGPRVQGGGPLEGGPQLEIIADDPRARKTEEGSATSTKTADQAHGLDGPHLSLPPEADVASTPTTQPFASPHTAHAPMPPETSSLSSPTTKQQTASLENGICPVKSDHQLVVIGLTKSYRKGPIEVPVLNRLNMGVRQGEFLAVVGSSGSGKSTLLHLLGTLDAPDAGEIHFEGRRIDSLPLAGRDALRNKRFGMIFQFYHLLPELNTLENVLAPLMIAHSTLDYFRRRRQHRRTATELLEMVGLGHRLNHKPRELSGGEMQRAAIARALVTKPDLLLADEPTGNLDQATGRGIMKIIGNLNRQQNLTIVMVTHDQAIAQQAHRVVSLVDGRIEE